MLACARIGAVHSVVFGGFSAEALRDRIQDAEAKLLITATSGYRRGSVVPLKKTADAAVAECPSIEQRGGRPAPREEDDGDDAGRAATSGTTTHGRAPIADCAPEWVDSEHLLYILYTSGTPASRKGSSTPPAAISPAAYATCKWVFDLKDDDVYWCTADIGWVTGHSYVVYGPLAAGATVLMYEGAPDWPKKDRFWDIIEQHKVTIFYTAPTAIRAFMKWGEQLPKAHDLSSLRLLGSVGEPINPEAWIWYHKTHRRRALPDRRHVVADRDRRDHDHAAARPRATKPGSATLPFPGIDAQILDERGNAGRGRRRLSGHHQPLAVDAARHLGRSGALRAAVLVEVAGHLLHRRRRQARRGRLLLAPRPRRRRHERGRPPHRHDGSGVRARRPPIRRRGRGRRDPSRHQGHRHRRVRDRERVASATRRWTIRRNSSRS